MRYKISYGKDGAAIVDARKNDVDAMIEKSLKMGVGRPIPMSFVEGAYRKAKSMGHPSTEGCTSALQWSNLNSELRYVKSLDVFVDTRSIVFRPMPPNTKLGPVSGGRVEFDRFRRRRR